MKLLDKVLLERALRKCSAKITTEKLPEVVDLKIHYKDPEGYEEALRNVEPLDNLQQFPAGKGNVYCFNKHVTSVAYQRHSKRLLIYVPM
jgi:hypothetical protein